MNGSAAKQPYTLAAMWGEGLSQYKYHYMDAIASTYEHLYHI